MRRYLRLGEVPVGTPLDKLLLGCFEALLIGLPAVDPDQLLSKFLWKKFRHLRRKRAAQSCFGDLKLVRIRTGKVYFPDLVLVNVKGCGQVIFAVETHIFDGVLILHAIVHIN